MADQTTPAPWLILQMARAAAEVATWSEPKREQARKNVEALRHG